jgi:Dual specificity phosphatase, catalytic domain
VATVLATNIQMDEVVRGLFISSLEDANKSELLRQHSIHTIISLGCQVSGSAKDAVSCVVSFPALLDTPDSLILAVLPETSELIRSTLDRNYNVLVHCVYGQSRSATVVTGYLVACAGLSLDASLTLLKSKHQGISINPGFLCQLLVYGSADSSYVDRLVLLAQFKSNLEPVVRIDEKIADLSGVLAADEGVVGKECGDRRRQHDARIDDRITNGNAHANKRLKVTDSDAQLSFDNGSRFSTVPPRTAVCKRCREMLFPNFDDSLHNRGAPEVPLLSSSRYEEFLGIHADDFWRGYRPTVESRKAIRLESAARTATYVVPTSWIEKQIVDTGGSLKCIKCNHDVGSYQKSGLVLFGGFLPCYRFELDPQAIKVVAQPR